MEATGLVREWRRRRLLQVGGVLAAGLGLPFDALADGVPSLKEVAGKAGLRYGSDSDIEFAAAPDEYRSLFAVQCGMYAPNLSWGSVCAGSRDCSPLRIDPNVAFADAHRIALTGAHLLWHENIPSWFGELTAPEAMRAAGAHITEMVQRFAGRTYAWNVLNEAIEPNDGRADGLKRTVVLDQLGLDYFDEAFRVARAADGKCLLAYNDYGMEMANRNDRARRAALLRLLDWFGARGTPIDAVGLQSHLAIDHSRFDETEYRQFLREVAAHKVKILISELDVFDVSTPPETAARDQAVGDLYGAFLRVALDEPAVSAVVTWGLSDRYTWLTPLYNPHFVRPDGLPARPLPFDRDFKPKPAFFQMIAAFEKAPHR